MPIRSALSLGIAAAVRTSLSSCGVSFVLTLCDLVVASSQPG